MASAELALERSFYIGNAFSGILYGVQIAMAFQSIHYLRKGAYSATKKYFFIGFSLLLALFVAIGFGANTLFGEFIWIEKRDVSGGPPAFLTENTAWWVNTFGTASGVAGNVIGDGLLLFRCYIIMGSSIPITILPALIYLASTALAIVSTIESALPNAFLLRGKPANFGVPWVSLSVAFNVIVTTMISTRILYAHRRIKGIAPPSYTKTYTGVMAILVESALPFAVLGIVFAVTYSKELPASFALAGVWGSLTGISPQLIILRVAMGIAWTRDTINEGEITTSMHFVGQETSGISTVVNVRSKGSNQTLNGSQV